MDRDSQEDCSYYDRSSAIGSWVERTKTYSDYCEVNDPRYQAQSDRITQRSSFNDQSTLNTSRCKGGGHEESGEVSRESYRPQQGRDQSGGDNVKNLPRRRDARLARESREASAAQGSARRQEELNRQIDRLQNAQREEAVENERYKQVQAFRQHRGY